VYAAGDLYIMGVSLHVRLLPSLTRPKRIDLLASNGSTFRYLLKGGDDLQQEQRMQQLLACINACVQAHHAPAGMPANRRRAASSSSTAATLSSGPDAVAGALSGRQEPLYANANANLRALILNVTPLGQSMGLVQWVPRSMTLLDVFKAWQSRMLERHQAATPTLLPTQQQGRPQQQPQQRQERQMQQHGALPGTLAGVRSGEDKGKPGKGRGCSGKAQLPQDVTIAHRRAMQAATAAVQGLTINSSCSAVPSAAGSTPAPAAPPDSVVCLKPVQLFYTVLQEQLRAGGHSPQLPRKQWPADVLLATFKVLLRRSPSQLLATELFTSANDAQHWWEIRNRYTASLALTSVASYLLGIGDRHLNNILIVQGTGQVVHIDSAVSFDQGTSLRVPEVVPFRLTQLLVAALGPLGAQVCVMQA
jgi:hypothetical protein